MTFFRWILSHYFSPWPKNDPNSTFNLSTRSNCFLKYWCIQKPATLHVILLDKKCFFLWNFWYIACLAFIKLFNLTRTSSTVDYVTQQRTFNGEHLNERFYQAPYLIVSDPKTHILHLFFTVNVNLFLWYSLCASFKTKIMVVLTIFILEREKITFFR